ncbi:MAG: hypothetical protein ACK6DT_09015 [Planctomycetota bacterium]
MTDDRRAASIVSDWHDDSTSVAVAGNGGNCIFPDAIARANSVEIGFVAVAIHVDDRPSASSP